MPSNFETADARFRMEPNGKDVDALVLPNGDVANVPILKTNQLTGGMGFTGTIVDMDEAPTDANTAAFPVGTLFISPEA